MYLKPKAVLFDLDDTLIDRSASLIRYAGTFVHSFMNHLVESRVEEVCAVICKADSGGYRARGAVSADLLQLLPWRDPPAIEALSEHWSCHFPGSSVGMSGLAETLSQLKASGVRTGLITNGGSRVQNQKLDTLGIRGQFETVLISDEVGIRKPDRAIFRLALRQLEVEPAQAWYVGDHPINDVGGARQAGLTSVWLKGPHPWPQELPMPNHHLESLSELLKLLERAPA